MSKKILPLGTAIKKQEDDDIYIIISRAFMKKPGKDVSAGYQCVLYPQGYGKKLKLQVIKEEEISKVITKGYTDELDIEFTKQKVEELEERIKNATVDGDRQTLEEKNKEEALDHEERLALDPFYKFRK